MLKCASADGAGEARSSVTAAASVLFDQGCALSMRRCIVRIIGLGFQAGEADNSIVNDSLFMAQVTHDSKALDFSAQLLEQRLLSMRVRNRSIPDSDRHVQRRVGHRLAVRAQELCEGGSLRDHVMLQMNRYNKVRRSARRRHMFVAQV